VAYAEEAEVVRAMAGAVVVEQDKEHQQQAEKLDVQTVRVYLLELHRQTTPMQKLFRQWLSTTQPRLFRALQLNKSNA